MGIHAFLIQDCTVLFQGSGRLWECKPRAVFQSELGKFVVFQTLKEHLSSTVQHINKEIAFPGCLYNNDSFVCGIKKVETG